MNLRDLVGDQLAQTGLGLAIGTAARYAMRIQDRAAIGWREIVADILLLGLNGFITYSVVERLGATGKGAILTAAMFGIAQDRVIRAFLRRSERYADQLDAALGVEVPPSPKADPHHVGKALREAHREPVETPVPDDLADLTKTLDKEP